MKTKHCLIGLLLLIVYCPISVWAGDFDHNHTLWSQILEKYVIEKGPASRVKYAALKQQGQGMLDHYLKDLSAISKGKFSAWNKSQQLAFLINAYNAYTVKLVVDNYPVDSIKDIGNIFRSSWKIKFFQLFGEKTHLDYIEHTLIRGDKDFAEPRIHFALVCASVGCPKLQSRAFTADRLEDMLERGTQAFLMDGSRNRFDGEQNKLHLSSLFKWYGEDFVSQYGSVQAFVAGYISADKQVQSLIESQQVEVNFLDYDWSLNDAG